MPHYTKDYYLSIREMHWACVECLVRPMCNERCNRTYLKHYLCERCNECSGFPCKEVEKLQMYQTVFNAYGHIMMEAYNKHIEETSFFRLIKPPEKSFDKWWF